ncbi:uncharacterized protein Z520_08416 [Fonsecaea multimorphosa CBS 102226]|uniref:Transcription factor domain-containing protein n=1 Tax=Fonsecaea multimorphosa CBS 102226 TaxID=1442371 RepID=A0A0D2JYP5_9EURO|nr:uncharacterized protein Z520_08416 [Fonsecaea multimorphosa CBS 102226]KIX95709.1 hypothetical protein Z520_08416 [Fonsecaea multimorphosa CBS 102226]OAL21446.1 hypothetical protein AYO22_07842 [Fonsecaea multimorphosa]
MPAHKAGLLFVNKTASSKSLSNSKGDVEDSRQIHKHVQKSRDYEKEKETRRKLKRARLFSLGWAPVSVAPRQTLDSAPLPVLSDASPSKGTRSVALRPHVNQRREADSECCATPEGPKHDVQKLSLVMPTGGSLDPFGQFRIPMNLEKHRILEYFVSKFFPAVTRSDIVAFMGHPLASTSSPAVQVVRRASSDELHVLALLAAASARMKFVDRYHFSRADLPERLADATLRLLRNYLGQARPITHELVQSILYLWAVESYRRNWEAVWTHGKMIMYLCNHHLGGFQNLDPYMRRMLWIADRFQAAATQSPPLIKERWGTEELTPQQYTCAVAALREHGKQPMGHGFTETNGVFSEHFQNLLDAVLELCCVIHCHWVGLTEQALIPKLEWAVARSYFIADELINFKEDIAGESVESPVSGEPNFQDCVRLALIVWMAFVPSCVPYAASAGPVTLRAAVDAKPLRIRLGRIVSNLHEHPASLQEQMMLLWVAGLGAVASELVHNQEWFAVHFQRLAKKLGIFSWEDFMPIQERFLLLDHLKAGSLTKLTWLLQRAVHADLGD